MEDGAPGIMIGWRGYVCWGTSSGGGGTISFGNGACNMKLRNRKSRIRLDDTENGEGGVDISPLTW